MSTIFISHSTQDKTIALQVSSGSEQGYEALFLDSDPESGIKAGSDWERELYRNLKLAAAVVVLCSPDSMASRWCFAEIAQAKALGKAIFPVVIRPCEVVGSLTDRQVIDMAGRGQEEGFQRLFDGLAPRDSTRPTVSAGTRAGRHSQDFSTSIKRTPVFISAARARCARWSRS